MDALPQLAILAIVAGLFSGAVILVFRFTIDFVLGQWLLPNGSESFESLSYVERFASPVIGAALVGVLLTRLAEEDRSVGVVHVMERLSRHQGYMPKRNAVVQFVGGIIVLVSGHSGGREGPAIHLGAPVQACWDRCSNCLITASVLSSPVALQRQLPVPSTRRLPVLFSRWKW